MGTKNYAELTVFNEDLGAVEFMTPTILVDLSHELEEAVEKAVRENR